MNRGKKNDHVRWRQMLSCLLMLALCITMLPTAARADQPPISSNITSTLMPYFTNNAQYYDSSKLESFQMGGLSYTDGYVFKTGYNYGYTGRMYFNLNREYSELSFQVGYVGIYKYKIDCEVAVTVDGRMVQRFALSYSDLPRKVSLKELKDARQVCISVTTTQYDPVCYGVGEIQLTPIGGSAPARSAIRSNIMYSCEPYDLRNCMKTYRQESNEYMEMTGQTYTDCYAFKMGYNAGYNAHAMFRLNGWYRKVSFEIGFVESKVIDCEVAVALDGIEVERRTVRQSDLAQTFSFDVTDVQQLSISLKTSVYDPVIYGLGNIQMESDGVFRDVVLNTKTLSLSENQPAMYLRSYPVPSDTVPDRMVWSSSDVTVATVDQKGLVRGVSGGSCTITATANGACKATCAVKVDLPQRPEFTDVPAEEYFAEPVSWAVAQGITTGTSPVTFGPERACTRAQAVTFLYRASGSPSVEGVRNPFTDVKPSDYYYSAVLWAVQNGITAGTSPTAFSPEKTVNRAQFVTFLYRAAGCPATGRNSSEFTDVAPSEYYYPAVLWAVGEGITSGTGQDRFSPGRNCIRAQIVTFLYRYFH